MAGNKLESLRVNFEEVKSKFLEKGLVILDTEYKGVNHLIEFHCSKHNLFGTVKWTNFKQDKGGCKACGSEAKTRKLQATYEDVKSYIESRGYRLLSNKYLNNREKIKIECETHGEFLISFGAFKNQLQGCGKCASEENGKRQMLTYENVKKEFEDRECVLISQKYEGSDIPLEFICPHHPNIIHKTTIGNLRSGRFCRQCKVDSIKGENSYLWRGGITPENKMQRMTHEYKTWRKQVFERDDYTCQCCENRGGKIVAHHVNSFSTHKDRRTDVTNGITLCTLCHDFKYSGSFHSVYGTNNNDVFELQEYLDETRTELGLSPLNLEDVLYK